PLAVERIGYGERRFGRTAAERQIGADGNRPQLALDLTQREQRRLARRIARITERVQQYLVGIGEAEEAAPARLGRQLVEEAAQRVVVAGNRDSHDGGGAVAQDHARRRLIDDRRTDGLHGYARWIATRASGVTNSCSG